MAVVWIFLAPMLVVVGLGALAASLAVVFGVGFALFEALGGPFEEAARELRRRHALRCERRDLERGRWAVLAALGERSAALAEVGVALGPVAPEGARAWRVGRSNREPVILLHRGSDRMMSVGGRELSVAAWLSSLEEALASRTVGPILARPIDDMASLRAAIEAANGSLPEALPYPPGSGRDEVLAFVRGRVPYDVVPTPSQAVLERRFEAYCAFHGEEVALEDMEDLFPEAEAARSWLAASRLVSDARDQDDDDPLQLYVAGERYVVLRFSFEEPWIVGDYPHAAAYLFDVVVRPALEAFRRQHRLDHADRFPSR